jgi:hypothetical protein
MFDIRVIEAIFITVLILFICWGSFKFFGKGIGRPLKLNGLNKKKITKIKK